MKINKNPLSSAIQLIVGMTFLGAGHQVYAEGNENFAIEEIIVSAQRREQSLQDVPISIQAFSEKGLEDAGVSNISQIATITPSLNMTQQLQAFTPFIRGVGSPDATVGQESTVAIYVDGVYQPNANASIFSFNSVERVEVLKGPQGTLFGRNATGGLIHIITRDPSQEAYGKASVSYGNYDTAGTKFYATKGLTDTVAADIAFFYKNQGEGYGDNLTLDTDINKTRERGVRTSFLFEPTELTKIKISLDYATKEGSTGIHHAVVEGSIAADGTTTAPDDYQDSFAALPGISESITKGFTARVDHALGELDFVSISSYRESSLTADFEQMASASPIVVIAIDEQSYETWSQEFQLMSKGESLDWIVGAFLYKDEAGFDGAKGITINNEAMYQNMIDTTSYAIFGEVVYSFSDSTRATAGVRWTRDERDFTQQFYYLGALASDWDDSESWDEPTWRLVLDHDVNEDMMVYASASRGFKSGNYNALAPVDTPPVNPEFINAYEVGVKSSLAEGRIQLNAAAFFYDYSDLQVSRIEAGSLVTVNAAEAEIKGIEMDAQANVTSHLSLRAGLSYVDSEYTSFEDAPVFEPSGVGGNVLVARNLSGNSLARSPDLTVNLGFTYTLDRISFGANYYHNDGFSWEPSGRIQQDSYSLVSAFLAWQDPESNWGVRLFGENLSDEEYATFVTEQQVGDNYEPAAPRTFGVELTYEF